MSVGLFGIAFFAMIGMMLIGLPIAVSMALVGIVGGIAAYGVPFMDSIAPVVWGVQNENLLTSIPLFVLLGELLLRSGIADRMYIALSAWLGRAARRAAAHQHRQLRAVRRDLGLVGGHRGDGRHGGAAVAAEARLLDARRRWARWRPAARWAS